MTALAAGIHADVPMETYLGLCCAGPEVQATSLFQFYDHCPAYAWARHAANPNREPARETDATSLGTLCHDMLLEPAKLVDVAVKPEGMSFATKEGKAWRAEHEGFRIVSADDWNEAETVKAAVLFNSTSRDALRNCVPERTLIAQDPETGLWLKSRPDAMRDNLVVNLKTAADARPSYWERKSVRPYGYHLSQALTAHVLDLLGEAPRPYAYVVVEKAARNPIVSVYDLSFPLQELGRLIMRRTLRRWADCVASGHWPGYGAGVTEIAASKSAMMELETLEGEDS